MKASKSMIGVIFAILTFFIGVSMNIQSGVNGQLRLITGNPIFASTINFGVGTAALVLLLLATTCTGIYRLPVRTQLQETSWWMWMGGPLGVIYVVAGVLIPSVIGYGAFFSMLVTGQLIFSVTIDHFGLFGNDVVKIDKRKAVGMILLLAGAFIVQNT